MSGGGHGIIRKAARDTLSDPMVHGALPGWLGAAVDAILAKVDDDWNECDCVTLGHALTWALCNL